MTTPSKKINLKSFDGGVRTNCELIEPDRLKFWQASNVYLSPFISRGAGLSYAAASFSKGGTSLSHVHFNRILDFDSQTNIVEVEAGITLYELYLFLINRGLYLAIQPGHGAITIGGCIAANVHGKNQKNDGNFIEQVQSLKLFHPSYGIHEISRINNPELFNLTCGGFGLTGNIISAKISTTPAPSAWVLLNRTFFGDCPSVIDGLLDSQEKRGADFSYTWHNFMSTEKRFGEGYVFSGGFSHNTAAVNALKTTKLKSINKPNQIAGFNRFTTKLINKIYQLQQSCTPNKQIVKLDKILFPLASKEFYFKLYGKKGFHEYQAIIPHHNISVFTEEVRGYVRANRIAIPLASAKIAGGSSSLLQYSGEGINIAINTPRTNSSHKFLAFLDGLALDLGGTPNIVKDSRLPKHVVDGCYPEADLFRNQLQQYDPKRLYQSELSIRLGL